MLARLVLLASCVAVHGHTNAVGFQAVANTAKTHVDLTIVYGTYHTTAPPSGALALKDSASGVEQYGNGGAKVSATYPMAATADAGAITWANSGHSSGSWTVAELQAAGWVVGTTYFVDTPEPPHSAQFQCTQCAVQH